jgi:tryptophanyl-tRNA synthetase
VEVKRRLAQALNEFLDPIRNRRAEYSEDPSLVDLIVQEGSARAREEAIRTLHAMKQAMQIDYFRDGTQP